MDLLVLPEQVWLRIFSYCRTASLVRMRRTCYALKKLIDGYVRQLPSSAMDLRARSGGRASDGHYRLSLKSFRYGFIPIIVYCYGMATDSPAEYLTLSRTGPGENCSYFKAGGCAFGTDVVTKFTKLRLLLPEAFDDEVRVSCADFTFALTQGVLRLDHGNGSYHTLYDRLLYGTVMLCDLFAIHLPHANADLRGTPFAFQPTFRSFGYRSQGAVKLDSCGQRALLQGQGFPGGCGVPCAGDAHGSTMVGEGSVQACWQCWSALPADKLTVTLQLRSPDLPPYDVYDC